MDLNFFLWETEISKLRQCVDRRGLTHQTSALRRFTRAIVVTKLPVVKRFIGARQFFKIRLRGQMRADGDLPRRRKRPSPTACAFAGGFAGNFSRGLVEIEVLGQFKMAIGLNAACGFARTTDLPICEAANGKKFTLTHHQKFANIA